MAPPVPQEADYWTILTTFAGHLKTFYAANYRPPADNGLAGVYYDGEFVAYKIKDHDSGNSTWDTWIDDAWANYVTYYVIPNSGGVQGFRKFTNGPLEDILRNTTRKTSSTSALSLIIQNGSFQNTDGGYDLSTQELSREVALSMVAFIDWKLAGNVLTTAQNARLAQLLEWALGHMNIWVNSLGTYCRPFMMGHTAKALIHYFNHINADSRIVPAVKAGADYIWATCWKGTAGAWGPGASFLYTDRVLPGNVEPQDGFTQPDLNMMVCPMFGFLWWQTGIQLYRDRGDLIFVGGIAVYSGSTHISGSDFNTPANPHGKQFDQQLFWGKDYLDNAVKDPVSGPVVIPPDTGGGGGTPDPGEPGSGLQGVPFIPFGTATFKGSKGCLIIPVRITFTSDDVSGAVYRTIYQAPEDGYCAIVGCMYANKLAHKLTFSTQNNDMTEMDFPAGAGIGKGISPAQPLFLSNKSGDLSVKSDLAFGPILFYVMEFKHLRFQ